MPNEYPIELENPITNTFDPAQRITTHLGDWETRVRERIKDRRWTIYICAEPDGQDCDSGTHPNICSHRCQAIRLFHETRRDNPDDESKWTPGPQIAEFEVEPVADEFQ